MYIFHNASVVVADFIVIFNADVAMTLTLKPGPVLDFLLANQNVREPRYIDWVKVIVHFSITNHVALGFLEALF